MMGQFVVVWWPSTAQDVEVIGPFRTRGAAFVQQQALDKEGPDTGSAIVELTQVRQATRRWMREVLGA